MEFSGGFIILCRMCVEVSETCVKISEFGSCFFYFSTIFFYFFLRAQWQRTRDENVNFEISLKKFEFLKGSVYIYINTPNSLFTR